MLVAFGIKSALHRHAEARTPEVHIPQHLAVSITFLKLFKISDADRSAPDLVTRHVSLR